MDYQMPIGAPDDSNPDEQRPGDFIQRELDRLSRALESESLEACRVALYAAQQALFWTLEPGGYLAPSEMIDRTPLHVLRGIPEG